jgi:hypothetical protein
MSTFTKIAACVTLASLVWFVGCRKEPAAVPPAANPPAPPANPAGDKPAAEQPPAGAATEAAKIEASFASLSAEDRALAVKQKICPVSEEPLGAMGTPIKVHVAGQDVFLCCEHCEDPLTQDPAKHLAKIGLTPAADAGPK